MIKGKMVYIILGIIIVVALLVRIFSSEDGWICVDGSWVKHGNPSTPKPAKMCGQISDDQNFILEGGKPTSTSTPSISTSTPTSTPATSTPVTDLDTNTQVIIESPQPGSIISSPLVVKGKARGNWFFEASLPIRLLDEKGEVIASVPAQAQSDWMTQDLVPFKALLEFNTTATSGSLVIAKDNPSGLPENEASVNISVRFLNK